MKKILIIAEYFRPGYKAGGPIKSIYNLANALNNCFDVNILTRSHDLNDSHHYNIPKNKWTNYENLNVYYNTENFSNKVYKDINLSKYEIIYLNSLFSSTTIKFLVKNNNFKGDIYISPRGELGTGALNLKKNKKLIFLKLVKLLKTYKKVTFIGSSKDEVREIKRYFPRNKIVEVSNIASNSNFTFINNKSSNTLNLFFVSRITRKKNINFLLESLLTVKGKVSLKIIGPIEDETYYRECLETVNKLPNNIKIDFLGSIEPNKIYSLIKESDFFVLPTLNENYGHVIAEALSYKKPVIISDNTPWNKYIIDHNLGFILTLDKNQWESKFQDLINMSEKDFAIYERSFMSIEDDNNKKNNEVIERYKNIFTS